MTVHGLAGLPRSGSTLLANVLDQHPDLHVSGTSALPRCVDAVATVLSNAAEVQSDLANVPGAYERYQRALRGLIDGWYADRPEPHIIDKGRGWIFQQALLNQLDPATRLIVCVRDPRDVIASIERQHRRTALFASPIAPTIYESADRLMKDDGLIGGPMKWTEDLLRRNLPGVIWVRYEAFTADPEPILARIHQALGLAPFTHDLDDVKSTASDLDALYRGKYPHDAEGPVKPNEATWQATLDPQLADQIAAARPVFMAHFGYS